MQTEQRNLLLLIVIGGSAVLASYFYAFSLTSEIRGALWGGVPEPIQPLYTVNMLLAAAGFFFFSLPFVFQLDAERAVEQTGFEYSTLTLCYALILIPSALWLPLTAMWIQEPGTLLWATIRIVLFAVGIGAGGLAWAALVRARRLGGAGRWLAVAGAVPFFLQTGVLDALVWPAYTVP